jgi:hypothetical protein
MRSRTRMNTTNSRAVKHLVDGPRGHLGGGPRLPREQSAVTSRTVHHVRISTAEKPRNNLQLAIDGSPKPHGVFRQNFGEM